MGASKQMEEARSDSNFFEYSASREDTLQPDIVEYDENNRLKQGLTSFLGAIPWKS